MVYFKLEAPIQALLRHPSPATSENNLTSSYTFTQSNFFIYFDYVKAHITSYKERNFTSESLTQPISKRIETCVTDYGHRDPIELIERHGGLGGLVRRLRFRRVTASGDTAETVEAIFSTSSSVSPLAVTVVLGHQEPSGGRAGDNFDPPDGGTCVIS